MSISEKVIAEAAKQLYCASLVELPGDIHRRLCEMEAAETSELARLQLRKIMENADIAQREQNVICQDTGIASYHIVIGGHAKIDGDIVRAVHNGTAAGTRELPAIPHSVHPITKANSGNGTGPGTPIIHWDVLPDAEYLEITAQPVGGGGDLCSAVKMFTGSAPMQEVKKFIVDTVAEAGSKPCPPMIIGVGLGGMFESVNQLAKRAVMRPLDQRHPDPMIQELEEELLGYVNALGIGPMGLGGNTTCLAVNIEYSNTGTYILPVAVKIGCWLIHRKTARLFNDGTVQYL